MTKEAIAKICHEANRAYCGALGDHSQPSWEEAPSWQKDSAIKGVELHLTGTYTPEDSHASWMKQKLDDGWKFGPVKDPVKKEHPCIVPYHELPLEQQLKDKLFKALVEVFK
jgi:hypothetical protein